MGLFGNFFSGSKNILNSAFYGWTLSGSVQYMKTDANTYVTDGYDNNIVYAAVRVLLNKQTEAPLLVSKVISEKEYNRYKAFLRDPNTPAARLVVARAETKAFQDVESGAYGTIFDLLKNPNNYQTSIEFWESFWLMYNLTGEAFIYTTLAGGGSNNIGKPTELHVLPSQNVNIVYSGDYKNPVRGYTFDVGGSDLEIPVAQVMHLKKTNPVWDTNGAQLRGYSPLKAGRKTLTASNLNTEAQAVAAKNGGAVTLLSGDPSKSKMSPEQMNKMDDLIKEKIQGASNYKNIVMTNGYLNAQKIGDNIVDMDLINADRRNEQKICSLFGVNPILIGSDVNSTENNVRAAYKSLVTNVVLTDLMKRDEKLTRFLAGFYKTGEVVRTDTTVYTELAPDLELMVKVFGQPRITENEKRELFKYGKSELPEMDKFYFPAGFVPIDQLNAGALTNDDYI